MPNQCFKINWYHLLIPFRFIFRYLSDKSSFKLDFSNGSISVCTSANGYKSPTNYLNRLLLLFFYHVWRYLNLYRTYHIREKDYSISRNQKSSMMSLTIKLRGGWSQLPQSWFPYAIFYVITIYIWMDFEDTFFFYCWSLEGMLWFQTKYLADRPLKLF